MALSVARQMAPGLKETAIGRALDSLWSKLSTPGRQPSLALGDERPGSMSVRRRRSTTGPIRS
jgi:hypothetical protein